MSYQVIARKYRPQRFSDVVGQEHVTQTLANAISQSRIAHAYLFVGPRGTGKTTIARIFAKALNCTEGPKVEFDNEDPRVKEITEGRSLDVLEIDGASNRGIDEIRELRETVKYAPASSKFKIYIVDEVHMLTKEAFNALLKTLEEPPAHVKFMFATTEPEKVLPTILSRCQRFDLRRIPSALIVQHLAHIAGLEQVKIDEGALHAIARGADGGMRDAESTLDQLISFCGVEIVEADVLSMFGLTAQAEIFGLVDALIKGDAEKALRQLDYLAKGGKDLGRLISDLLNCLRNLLIFQVSKGDWRLLEVSESEKTFISSNAGQVASESLTRMLEALTQGESGLRDATSKKIFVEVSLLKVIEARNAISIDAVLKQLNQLRSNRPGETQGAANRPSQGTAGIVTPVKAAQVPPVADRKVETAAGPTSPMVTGGPPELTLLWSQLLESVGKANRFLKTYLLEAHPVGLANGTLTIGFDSSVAEHVGLVDNPKNHALLKGKLEELGVVNGSVKFVEAARPSGWVGVSDAESNAAPQPIVEVPKESKEPRKQTAIPVTPANPGSTAAPAKARSESVPFSKEDFKNDPLIQKALEVFKGQIVDVRM